MCEDIVVGCLIFVFEVYNLGDLEEVYVVYVG